MNFNKVQWIHLYMGLLILFMVGPPIYYSFHGGFVPPPNPANERIEAELRGEYEKIQPLPGAVLLRTDVLIKHGEGGLVYIFLSELSYQEVLSYYDKQLKYNGWSYYETEKITSWFKDTGTKANVYQKGEYTAKITYGGEEVPAQQFFVTISWHPKK